MITNAIPGITNINALVNTAPTKGIAASKEQTADFYKTLNNANTQKQASAISSSIAKTLTNTGAVYENNKNTAAYERTQDLKQSQNVSGENANSQNVNRTDTTRTAENRGAAENSRDTGEEVKDVREAAEVPEEVIDQTEEQEVVAEVFIPIPENPEGDGAVQVVDEALTALEQAMLDDSRQLMQQLADTLGMSIEDIENAMATLGLTNVAILDPTNLTQIIGEVTNADDVMAIVTNADLYLNVQNMQDAVDTTRQNLMEEFNLTEEGLSSALQNFNESLAEKEAQSQILAAAEENVNAKNPATFETPAATLQTEAVRLDITGGEGVIKEVTSEVANNEVMAEDVSASENLRGRGNDAEVPDFTLKVEAPVAEQVKSRETGSENSQNNDNSNLQQNTDGSMYNQVMNQISSSLSEVVETESYGQMARVGTQDIMDQITEFIKMNVKADSTTMEMQLHPASLGNVNVIIEAARDGNVVAKFLTQNEDVRAAIESQLQQLQDRLNEQGVKVTAVEVTVNAGAFDQTLNDSQSQREDDQDAQESIRKPMRRIRLDDLTAEDFEEIDEEDQLTAEMMAINGNTVDFSA
ncbi:flagellar hook-length control protein FliK [Butyrivibrio sp. WCE2006]|uniref:flagellar hook-length control protein FliK n=1 Tax=Butyrivibrio sp. WCE2006 TaxID=1410611 RepID=UPI0005D19859|nr:flagellar hook-length control protein FliK [Butyrivibrio sp. WCE2006]